MAGLGTIINSASIIAGGVAGHFTGRLFCQKQQDSLNKACGDAEFVNAFISFPIDTEFFTASPQPISLGTSTILTKYSRPGVSHNHLDFFFACHGGISRLRHGQRAMRRPVIDGYAGIPFGHKAVDEARGKGIPAASLPQLYRPAP